MCKRTFHCIHIVCLIAQHGVFYVFNEPVSVFIHLAQMEIPYLSRIEFTGFQFFHCQLMCIINTFIVVFAHDGIEFIVPNVSSSFTSGAYHW